MGKFFQSNGYDVFVDTRTDWWGDGIIDIEISDSGSSGSALELLGLALPVLKIILVLFCIMAPFFFWINLETFPYWERFAIVLSVLIPSFIILIRGRGTVLTNMIFMSITFLALALFSDKVLAGMILHTETQMLPDNLFKAILEGLFAGACLSALPSLLLSLITFFIQAQRNTMKKAFSLNSKHRMTFLGILGMFLAVIWWLHSFGGIITHELIYYYIDYCFKATNISTMLIFIYANSRFILLIIPIVLFALALSGKIEKVAAYLGWYLIDYTIYLILLRTQWGDLNITYFMPPIVTLLCLFFILFCGNIAEDNNTSQN